MSELDEAFDYERIKQDLECRGTQNVRKEGAEFLGFKKSVRKGVHLLLQLGAKLGMRRFCRAVSLSLGLLANRLDEEVREARIPAELKTDTERLAYLMSQDRADAHLAGQLMLVLVQHCRRDPELRGRPYMAISTCLGYLEHAGDEWMSDENLASYREIAEDPGAYTGASLEWQ